MPNLDHLTQRLATLSPAKRALLELEIQKKNATALGKTKGDELKVRTPGLILLQNSERLPSVFWAPSVGSIERFVECHHLARLLEEHCSFCGFEPAPEFTDIRSLAGHCIRLMRAEQPDGPYALAGFCHCGHVAYEIARQLEDQGEKISLLVVFDCSARDFAPNLRQRFHWLRDGFRGQPGVVLNRVCSAIRRKIAKALGRPVVENSVERDDPSDVHARAVRSHKVKPFHGKVVLFRSAETLELARNPNFGWDALARPVEAHTVPCRHSSMMVEPAIHFIAEELKQNWSIRMTRD